MIAARADIPAYRVMKVRFSDRARVARLREAAHRRFERFSPRSLGILRVGEEDVGLLRVRKGPFRIVVKELLVVPAWRNRGIGGTILRRLKEAADETGKKLVVEYRPAPRAVKPPERGGKKKAKLSEICPNGWYWRRFGGPFVLYGILVWWTLLHAPLPWWLLLMVPSVIAVVHGLGFLRLLAADLDGRRRGRRLLPLPHRVPCGLGIPGAVLATLAGAAPYYVRFPVPDAIRSYIPLLSLLLVVVGICWLYGWIRRAGIYEAGIRIPDFPLFLPWAALDRDRHATDVRVVVRLAPHPYLVPRSLELPPEAAEILEEKLGVTGR